MKRLSLKMTLLIMTGVLLVLLAGIMAGVMALQSASDGRKAAYQHQRLALVLLMDQYALTHDGVDIETAPDGEIEKVIWDNIPVDEDQVTIDRVSAVSGAFMTLFTYDAARSDFIRVSTFIKNADGSRAVGTTLARDNPAYAALMAKQGYSGAVDLFGKPHRVRYEPIFSATGALVGAVAAAIDGAAYNETVHHGLKNSITAAVVLISIGLALLVWLVSVLLRPLSELGLALERMSQGDLDTVVSHAGRADEIGMIASKAESFREGLRQARNVDAEARRKQEDANRVVQDLRAGLGRLAAGDLTQSLDQAFPAQYEELRIDFNASLETLSNLIAAVMQNVATIRARSNDIGSASENLSLRTENQAATLEETAAAMDEMTTSVRAAANSAGQVESVVRLARSNAEDSGRIVNDATLAMAEIKKSSDKINQIISVIDDIAFQTNLLALNAGVEAARAGDAGRGFAVVASEVRALAQRSSEAAKEIKMLISASTDQVTTGVSLVNRTGAALSDIVERVANISELVSEIASGAQQQSSGLGEINLGVTQLDQVTQQNAAMVEEVTAASGLLRQEAEALELQVSRFAVRDTRRQGTVKAISAQVPMQGRFADRSAQVAAPVTRGGGMRRTANGAGWQEF